MHATFTALCVIELELLSIEVLHCGVVYFYDLDLYSMTFICELDPYSLICTADRK